MPNPWSLRLAAATGERAALEIYDNEDLVDVMVAPSLAGRVLRGARASICAGRPRVIAWGCLPADGTPLAAAFVGGHAVARVHPVPVTGIGGRFWVAAAEGRFRKVIVTFGDSAARLSPSGVLSGRPAPLPYRLSARIYGKSQLSRRART